MKTDYGLEPLADRDSPPNDFRVQLSIAISLKRLADHLTGTDERSGLVDALYDMAQRR